MDRDVLDTIEREIDQEVRARFPGTAVRQAVLLQYGDDPEIEPGALWVRVLLDADGPEDNWEPALTAFEQANKTAVEQFQGYLAAKLREISLVEYTFTNNPITSDDKGPRAGYPVGGPQLSDVKEWEHGEATFVLAALGPAGLETVDTLIMAGIAATRAEAIRWVLDRVREQQAYQRLPELRSDAEMDRDVLDTIEREIDQEVRARFPGTAVRQAVLLQYGDDPEIEPGALWVRVLLDADQAEDYDETLTAFHLANTTAKEQFTSYLAEKLREIRLVEYTFSNNPVTFDGHGPRLSNPVGERLPDIQEREHGEATPLLARLGPVGLETLDTLIMAGTTATRAEAIRWALDRIREQPPYQRLRELRSDADKLKNEL